MEVPVTKQNIDHILKFLPIFAEPNTEFYEVETEQLTFHACDYSPNVESFVQALYEENFVNSFDWLSWQEEASRYIADPQLIIQADLPTLRKLLTTHVRADRFNDGHLADVIDSGHILAILTRLQALRDPS